MIFSIPFALLSELLEELLALLALPAGVRIPKPTPFEHSSVWTLAIELRRPNFSDWTSETF